MNPIYGLVGKRWLRAWLCHVFVADDNSKADIGYASEHVGSNVGTVQVIAEIFGEYFFLPVWIREARFDGYSRNGESPD